MVTKLHKNNICYHRELEYYFLECTYTEYNILSKRLRKICKIKPRYLNFQWLIGPSSIYVAKQQRTSEIIKKNIFLTFQWLCLILYLYKHFLRLGQNLPLSYSLLSKVGLLVLNNNDPTKLIRVITKLPNSEQSYKGKVKTHKYINRQNQSTTRKLWKP